MEKVLKDLSFCFVKAGFNNDLDERMAQLKEKLLSEKITSRRKAP